MTTIITLVVLVSVGIVLVDGECQTNGGPIDNCCYLGYNSNNFNEKSSGVYTIGNFCGVKCSNVRVYCDTTSGGGGWTVILKRQDSSIDFFNNDWTKYEDGFGSVFGEFWLGLRSIHCLTSKGNWELRIDYQLSNGTLSYLHYKQFAVGSPETQYQLSISGFYTNGLTDPFSTRGSLNGMKFSSRDKENDRHTTFHCAKHEGGWWHNACTHIRLLDRNVLMYLNDEWIRSIVAVEMKIRPLYCNI